MARSPLLPSRGAHRVAPLLAAAVLVGCGGEDLLFGGPGPPAGPRAELADERALAALSAFRAMPVLGEGRTRETGSQDRGTGAPVPVPLLGNSNRDMNNFVCASADATIAEAQLMPFTFDETACPERYVRGAVLARFEGAGALVRLWLTMLSIRSGGVADEEVLRIYIDDAPAPVVEAKLAAILDGTAGEMFAPPFSTGAGDHLAWYYPVVFARKLVIALDQLGPLDLYYHQATAVLDPPGTTRGAAPERLPARDAAIAALRATEDGPIPGGQALLEERVVTLPPGAPTLIADLPGPATIDELRLVAPIDAIPSLADVDVSVVWDGAASPAMALPLAELFAAALAPPAGASLPLSGKSSGGDAVLALRLPMPFATRARLSATSHLGAPINITVSMRGEAALPPASWGHLHVLRSETVAPASGPLHPLASVTGRGRWVGACMMMEGHGLRDGSSLDNPLNFLEGDERAVIDGESAIAGTGTEDYFNSAFYFESGPMASPFAQWWDVSHDGTAGRASACRWHVLGDTIDFTESAEIAIEIGPADPAMLDRYRSVAFFYLRP